MPKQAHYISTNPPLPFLHRYVSALNIKRFFKKTTDVFAKKNATCSWHQEQVAFRR